MLKWISESLGTAVAAFGVFGLIKGYFPMGKDDITVSAIALIVLGVAATASRYFEKK